MIGMSFADALFVYFLLWLIFLAMLVAGAFPGQEL